MMIVNACSRLRRASHSARVASAVRMCLSGVITIAAADGQPVQEVGATQRDRGRPIEHHSRHERHVAGADFDPRLAALDTRRPWAGDRLRRIHRGIQFRRSQVRRLDRASVAAGDRARRSASGGAEDAAAGAGPPERDGAAPGGASGADDAARRARRASRQGGGAHAAGVAVAAIRRDSGSRRR